MFWILLVIVVLALVIVGFFATRWWENRSVTSAEARLEMDAPVEANNPRWFWQSAATADRVQAMRAWVPENAGNKQVEAWFAEQPDETVRNMIVELDVFAKRRGFNLDWALGMVDVPDEKLQKELRSAIVQYLKARQAADGVSGNIEDYTLYRDLVTNPARNLEKLQSLYTELVNRDLAPTTPPDMVMANSATRRAFLVDKIKQAAATDWKQFNEAMQTVMVSDEPEAVEETATESEGIWTRTVTSMNNFGASVANVLRFNRSSEATTESAPATDASTNTEATSNTSPVNEPTNEGPETDHPSTTPGFAPA